MNSLAELYQSVIIEHDRSPRNYRALAMPSHRAEGRNPLCGDEVSVELAVLPDGTIDDVAFQCRGCAVSRASASMMTVALRGKSTDDARELFGRFRALLVDGGAADPTLGRLQAFGGLTAYPMRVKCATMAWHAMIAALSGDREPQGDSR